MDLTAAALFSAHRFFKAAMIAALPAALSFLLGLEAGAVGPAAYVAMSQGSFCVSPKQLWAQWTELPYHRSAWLADLQFVRRYAASGLQSR